MSVLSHLARRWKAYSVVLAALLALAGVGLAVDDTDGDDRPDRVVITLPGQTVVADPDQQIDPSEQAAAADPTPTSAEIHEDARDETPPGISPAAARQIITTPTQGVGAPRPVGGAQKLACAVRLVRNRSSRAGARVKLFVLHYTVSRPGSLDAIRRLFDTSSFAASATYGLEPSGRCEQWVPNGEKPWTQLSFNPVSESVEIIAMGTETRAWWLAQPIIRDGLLAELVRDRLRANGLPLRRVDPVGCGIQQAGWTDHNALECGNSHHDVMPNFPYDVLQAQIAAPARLTRTQRRQACQRVHAYRQRRHAGRAGTRAGRARQARRLKRLRVSGLTCVNGRPRAV